MAARSPASVSQDERTWAMLAHLLTFLGYAVALGSFVPPLVILVARQERSEFVADQAKESLNFQITMLLAVIAGSLLVMSGIFTCVGVPLLLLLALAQLVLVTLAGIRAYEGDTYRYPFAFRFIS